MRANLKSLSTVLVYITCSPRLEFTQVISEPEIRHNYLMFKSCRSLALRRKRVCMRESPTVYRPTRLPDDRPCSGRWQRVCAFHNVAGKSSVQAGVSDRYRRKIAKCATTGDIWRRSNKPFPPYVSYTRIVATKQCH